MGNNVFDQGRITLSGSASTDSRFNDITANFAVSVASSEAITVSGLPPTQTGSKAIFTNGKWRSLDNCRYREGRQTELTCTAAFTGTPGVGEYALIGVANKDGSSGFLWGSLDGEEVFLFRKGGTNELFKKNQDGDWVNSSDWNKEKANVWALGFVWHGNAPATLDRLLAQRQGYDEIATLEFQNVRTDASLDDPDVYVWIESSANMAVEVSSWALGYYGGSRDNLISQGNSYDYTEDGQLAAGATYTGEWVDLADFAQANTVIQMDQTATMDFEYSHNGVTALVGTVPTFNHDGNGGARRFQLGVYGRYYRVKIKNTSASPADLIVQTILLPVESRLSIHRIGDTISSDRSAEVVKAVTAGQQPDLDWINQKADGEAFNNETPLLAGQTYTSDWYDSDGWSTVELFIATDQVSAGSGIRLEYTDDVQAATPIVRGEELFTFGADDVAIGFLDVKRPTALDGFRVKYTNGLTDQGSFYLSATLRVHPAGAPLSALEAGIDGTQSVQSGRTAIFGENPSGEYGLVGRGGFGEGVDTHVTDSEPRAVRKPMSRRLVSTHDLTTTSIQIDSTQLASRSAVLLTIDPDNNQPVHINLGASATTTSMKLDAGYGIPMTIDNNITIHGRSASGTQRVYLWQFGEPL